MTWLRFTRKGPWHAQVTCDRDGLGVFYVARCWRETRWPQSHRTSDPPANEPRCKLCLKAMEDRRV